MHSMLGMTLSLSSGHSKVIGEDSWLASAKHGHVGLLPMSGVVEKPELVPKP